MQLAKPANDGLNGLLWASNQTAAAFDKPQLYSAASTHSVGHGFGGRGSRRSRSSGRGGASRSLVVTQGPSTCTGLDCSTRFHISIAWSLSSPTEEVVARQRSANISELKSIGFTVRNIKVKVGNAVTAFSLEPKSIALGGILGK